MTGPVIRPYGDTTGDGQVQVSFTLPVPFGDEEERALAEGAALQLAGKMGLDPAMVVHAKGMGPDFTFFIVYGRVSHLVDVSEVTVFPSASCTVTFGCVPNATPPVELLGCWVKTSFAGVPALMLNAALVALA